VVWRWNCGMTPVMEEFRPACDSGGARGNVGGSLVPEEGSRRAAQRDGDVAWVYAAILRTKTVRGGIKKKALTPTPHEQGLQIIRISHLEYF
jgi:hypothetical protein